MMNANDNVPLLITIQEYNRILQLGAAAIAAGPSAVGAYTALYQYIANTFGASLQPDQKFWFNEAAEVNGNNASNPAAYFIRDETSLSVPNQTTLQQLSNNIGLDVFNTIRLDKLIPTFETQLNADISTALGDNVSIGGWGGSFYYWNYDYKTDINGQPVLRAARLAGLVARQRPKALRRSLLVAQFARQATRLLSLDAT